MALTDSATLNIGTGHLYLAPVSTVAPTDFRQPEVAWKEIGHTSLDDIFTVSSEGGDSTVLGTLQSPSLRTTVASRTESFGFNLAQWDEASLKLYFGSNAAVESTGPAAGLLGVPSKPAPTTNAFLAVYYDGDVDFVIYAQKAEISRGDDFSLSDTTSLALLPIKVTPLSVAGAAPYHVKPLGS